MPQASGLPVPYFLVHSWCFKLNLINLMPCITYNIWLDFLVDTKTPWDHIKNLLHFVLNSNHAKDIFIICKGTIGLRCLDPLYVTCISMFLCVRGYTRGKTNNEKKWAFLLYFFLCPFFFPNLKMNLLFCYKKGK